MKKKIVFCMQTMVMGGVEKELVTIIKSLNKDIYDISILLFYIEDVSVMAQIPDWVNVIDLKISKDYYFSTTLTIIKTRLKKFKLYDAMLAMINRVLAYGLLESINNPPKLGCTYDVAICYHIFSPAMFKYVAENIGARKKIAWIHNDFHTTGYRLDKLKRYLVKYDEVVAVSNRVMHEFKSLCPFYSGKASVAHNIINKDEIIRKAEDNIEEDYFKDRRYKLLTIARYTEQKGIDIAIETMRLLRDQKVGNSMCWYIIGWGSEETKYQSIIRKYSLDANMVLLGRRDNPYPYLKECDLYVQPSRHEAYALCIIEAKTLMKPILCTNFAGADEQITNGVNGCIIDSFSPESISKQIINLYENPEICEQYRENLKTSLDFQKELRDIMEHLK